MKKWLGLIACIGCLALPATAQLDSAGTPSFELGGGYTYRSFNGPSFPNPNYGVSGGPEPRMSMNGWFATVDYNFNGFIGVVTDIDWTRASVPNDPNFAGDNTFSSVLVGPQIYPIGHHIISPFAHVEFGLAHFNNDISNFSFGTGCDTPGSFANPPFTCSLTEGSFAVAAGGGVDISLGPHFAVRLAQLDWEHSRMFEPGGATGNSDQNNWKFKAGVLFRFGQR